MNLIVEAAYKGFLFGVGLSVVAIVIKNIEKIFFNESKIKLPDLTNILRSIFWLSLSIVVPKIVNEALYPVFNNPGSGNYLLDAALTAAVPAICAAYCFYKAFPKIFQNRRIKCPECLEKILKDARICKHCGSKLVPVQSVMQLQSEFNSVFVNQPDSAWNPRWNVFAGVLVVLTFVVLLVVMFGFIEDQPPFVFYGIIALIVSHFLYKDYFPAGIKLYLIAMIIIGCVAFFGGIVLDYLFDVLKEATFKSKN